MPIFQSKWMLYLVLGILAFAYITNPKNKQSESEEATKDTGQQAGSISSESIAVQGQDASGVEGYIKKKLQDVVDVVGQTEKGQEIIKHNLKKSLESELKENNVHELLVAKSGKLSTLDVKVGSGDVARCGNTVRVHYKAFLPGALLFDQTAKESPLAFQIGNGKVIKGLEQGVIGLKQGGTRKIIIPPLLAHDDPNFKTNIVPANKVVTYEVTLLKVDDSYKVFGLKAEDNDIGRERQVICGDNVVVEVSEISKSGAKPSISQKLEFSVGDGEVPIGLEAAVLGMQIEGLRTVSFDKTLNKTRGKANIVPPKIQALFRKGVPVHVRLLSIND